MNNDIIDLKSGMYYAGNNEERYKECLKLFYKTSGQMQDQFNKYISENDLELYKIKIHSLKGLAKSIGARKLSGLAENIENNCAEYASETVTIMWDGLIREWKNVLDSIKNYTGEEFLLKEEVFKTNGIRLNNEEFSALCNKIIRSLNAFDVDEAEKGLCNLLEYDIDENTRIVLLEGLYKTRDFEYDKAADRVNMALDKFAKKER